MLKRLLGVRPLGILFWILTLLVLPFYLLVAVTGLRSVRLDAEQAMAGNTRLLVEAVGATMTTHAAMLTSVGEGLLSLGALENPEKGRALIERMATIDPGMAGFGLARTDGQLVLVSHAPSGATLPNLTSNEQSRVSFQKALQTRNLQSGHAYYFDALEQWVIPIRIAVRDGQGRARAVMTAGYRIEGGTAAWARMSLGPGVRVVLMHDDGYRLYQHPLPEGSDNRLYQQVYGQAVNSDLLQHLRDASLDAGIFEVTLDDAVMLGAWQRLNDYGLYALTLKPLKDVQRTQWLSVATPTLWLLAFLMGGFLVFRYTAGLQAASDAALRKGHVALVHSEGLLRMSQEAAHMGIYTTEVVSGQWTSSPMLDAIFGISADFPRTADGAISLIHPEDREAMLVKFKSVLAEHSAFSHEYRIVRPDDGQTRWIFVWGDFECDSEGHPLREVGAIQDITERKQAEIELRKLSLAVEQSPESILITNLNAEIEYVNEAFVQKTGFRRDEAVGANPRILQSGKTPAKTYASMWSDLTHGRAWKGEFCNRSKDGNEFIEHAIITPIRQDDGQITHYVAVNEDITARKLAQDKINSLIFYDTLTGLPNRRMLLDRLRPALVSCARNGRHGAILLIDLDNFKSLNDTLGHDLGDQLLQQVAGRLLACAGEGDTVARLGGDEFVVMLEDLSHNSKKAVSHANSIGNQVITTLNAPYQLAGHEHHSTPSIGVVLFSGVQQTVDELLKQVELAMYQAKSAGRNSLCFFDSEMQATATNRAVLEADLRRAILVGELVVYYQCQVIGEGRLTGAEALVRWQHPTLGLMLPGEFIPLAEEVGLILPLGQWVLNAVCQQLALWAKRPETAHLTIAVNISARQFRVANFVEETLAVIDRTGANPQRLKLELTESVLVEDVEGVIAKMSALKIKGVCFSLDDFGTGYSSLSYLKRLPLDQLKIDQGFVRDMLTDPNDAAIAKMVIALAESMNLGVIAEGVEIAAQRDFLAQHGCHAYQGYLFSRPLSIDDFEAYARAL